MCNKLWLCHYFLIYLSFLLTCDLLNSVFFSWNRDWARPNRLWNILLLPGNHFLLWQGPYCNGQCRFSVLNIFSLNFEVRRLTQDWLPYGYCHHFRSSFYLVWVWQLVWNPLCSFSPSLRTTRFESLNFMYMFTLKVTYLV